MNLLESYHKILSEIKLFHQLAYGKPKAGRKPKISDEQIMALMILSYLLHSPFLTLAKELIDPSIGSYHIFRKARMKRIYSKLRQYMLWRTTLLIVIKILAGKKIKLIVDGAILPVANINRARTQRIKRFAGKVFWTKRQRKLYSVHYRKHVEFEEVYYGVLVMVLCDENGVVYDVWFTYGNMHESKAYGIRKTKSKWFKELVESHEVYGDKAYKYVEGVKACSRRNEKGMRQVVEGVIGAVKSFNVVSRWRKGITLLCYLYAYSIAYSFFRRKNAG